VPRVWGDPGALSIGYERDFVLPLVIRPDQPGSTVDLRGVLDIGVCREVCLPARLKVSGVLPPSDRPDPAIEAALTDRPRVISSAATCLLRPASDGLTLTGEIAMPPLGEREAVVFELPDPLIWVTDARVTRRGDGLTAISDLMVAGGGPVGVDRSRIRITVLADGRAVELAGCD
jgi:DsbC/DsbD-like thiol-disulfide interchange protein